MGSLMPWPPFFGLFYKEYVITYTGAEAVLVSLINHECLGMLF